MSTARARCSTSRACAPASVTNPERRSRNERGTARRLDHLRPSPRLSRVLRGAALGSCLGGPGKSEVRATGDMFTAATLAELRVLLPPGLTRVPRMQGDEPQIVEVWL